MRISITAMDDFHTTRHSSLILCYLDFIFLKAIPVLKEKLNNIGKQAECFPHLQLVSSDASRVNQPARNPKGSAIWLKNITKMVRWTAYNSLWLMCHEQIKELNMKMKTDKGSSLLV
jgi:hypothetical protein